MRKANWLGNLALGLALLGAAPVRAQNFILLLADDQGWTGTSVAMDGSLPGSRSTFYKTPALERLARDGMRFSNAYSPHPNCSPTRMSIQTGKSPARLGAYDIIDVVPKRPGDSPMFYETSYVNKPLKVHLPISDLPDSETTVAELLKKRNPGYVTAHFGKWHMGGGGPSQHGYDHSDGATTNAEGNQGPPNPKLTPDLTARAVKFLREQAASKKPFFMQVSYYAVHTRVLANPETTARFEGKQSEHHKNAQYAAMTYELDSSVGAILAALDESKLASTTYVIYTSDNGGETMGATSNNFPLNKSKTFCWEGGIRVPLIVRGPKIAAGSQSDVPAIGWDFLPTIADLVGVKALPANVDGGSLRAVLEGKGKGAVKRPDDALIWYYPAYRDMKGVRPQGAIRVGNYKLIKEYESGKLSLFDLAKDIGELDDLSGAMPEQTQLLAQRFDAYLKQVGAKIPSLNPDYVNAAPPRSDGQKDGEKGGKKQ